MNRGKDGNKNKNNRKNKNKSRHKNKNKNMNTKGIRITVYLILQFTFLVEDSDIVVSDQCTTSNCLLLTCMYDVRALCVFIVCVYICMC
jgi:hypothetical protein